MSHDHQKCSFTLAEHAVDIPISSFQRLLNTSYIIPDSKISSVRSAIAQAEATLVELKHKKMLWHEIRKQLEEQESTTGAYIDALKARLPQSALSRTPFEVLGRIFFFANNGDHLFANPNTSPLPITVAQVCQRWRKAALAHPGLWTRLCMSSTLPWWRPSFISLVGQCLMRSGQQPLSISIEEPSHGPGQFKSASPIMLLLAYSPKIGRIYLDVPNDSLVWKALKLLDLPFPSLTSVYLCKARSDMNTSLIPIFVTSLTSDSYRDEDILEDSFAPLLERTTHLILRGPYLRTRINTLKSATSVRELTWICTDPPPRQCVDASTESIILPSVKKMTFLGQGDLESELGVLQLPQLKSIFGPSISKFCESARFLTPGVLTTLTIFVDFMDTHESEDNFPQHMKDFLRIIPRVAPKLDALLLTCGKNDHFPPPRHFIDQGLQTLIHSMFDQNQRCFPSLRKFVLCNISFSAHSELLFRMLNERTTEQLREVEIAFHNDTPSWMVDEYRQRVGAAMEDDWIDVAISVEC